MNYWLQVKEYVHYSVECAVVNIQLSKYEM